MTITNLQLHGSTASGSQEYYTADLENEKSEFLMSVRFAQDTGTNNWTAYNLGNDDGYEVLRVGSQGGSQKENIETWRNGDQIRLGSCVQNTENQ